MVFLYNGYTKDKQLYLQKATKLSYLKQFIIKLNFLYN